MLFTTIVCIQKSPKPLPATRQHWFLVTSMSKEQRRSCLLKPITTHNIAQLPWLHAQWLTGS